MTQGRISALDVGSLMNGKCQYLVKRNVKYVRKACTIASIKYMNWKTQTVAVQIRRLIIIMLENNIREESMSNFCNGFDKENRMTNSRCRVNYMIISLI